MMEVNGKAGHSVLHERSLTLKVTAVITGQKEASFE
jgi:hypothetical protein